MLLFSAPLKIVPEVFASPVEDRWSVGEPLKEAGLDQYIPAEL
jgi:hypothetical protein